MALLKALTGLVCCAVLYGCAVNPVEPDTNRREAIQLVAVDLVNALVQVPSIPLGTTTLNLSAEQFDDGDFATALLDRFERVGYSIRTVGSNPADQPVSYQVEQKGETESGESTSTFTVSIGSVSVRRNYAGLDSGMGSDGVYPTAAMQVKGVDASYLRLSDDIFQRALSTASTQSAESSVENAISKGVEPNEAATMDTTTGIPPRVESGDSLETDNLQSETLARLQQRPLQNFRELERSNFSDLFQTLTIVREAVLPFDNDSVDLNAVARAQIGRFVEDYGIQSDVFSVIGCSNGSTTVAGGPKRLALGRAGVVTAELERLGVPPQSILEEGCWSGEYFDEMMPRRGVVLSLQRYKAS